MTLYLLAANRAGTLATDDPVIAAADVGAVNDMAAAVARAGALRDDMAARVAETADEAATAARAAGHAEGLAAAAAEVQAELFALTLRAAAERSRVRAEVTMIALEVVRRIAAEIGEPKVVAGLAERAAAALLPDEVATVRVPAAALAAVADRLQRHAGLTVVADATLEPNGCVVTTALGSSHAGLDLQLAAVERAWASSASGDAG